MTTNETRRSLFNFLMREPLDEFKARVARVKLNRADQCEIFLDHATGDQLREAEQDMLNEDRESGEPGYLDDRYSRKEY